MDVAINSAHPATISLSALSMPPDGQLVHEMADTGFRFFDLPRELRDMVYTLLYGERRGVKLRCRHDHRFAEEMRKSRERSNFVPSAFPESSINHLLSANKQFFEEAAMTWTSTKVFIFGDSEMIRRFLLTSHPMHRQILLHITDIEISMAIDVYAKQLMRFLPRLARVSLGLTESDLEVVDGEGYRKSIWESAFTELELAGIVTVQNLLSFRGLESLTLKWAHDSHPYYVLYQSSSDEDGQVMNANLARIQKLADDIVTRAPESPVRRKRVQSFQEALKSSFAARKSEKIAIAATSKSQETAMAGPPPLLMDHDIPKDEAALLRLVHLRPKAVLQWMRSKARQESVAHAQ